MELIQILAYLEVVKSKWAPPLGVVKLSFGLTPLKESIEVIEKQLEKLREEFIKVLKEK